MKLRIFTILAISSFNLLCSSVISQEALFSHESFIGSQGDTLPYRQMVSDDDLTAKYPLVIFMHGSGECGTENNAQLKWGVLAFASKRIMKTYRPIVIAPQIPCDEEWDNVDPEEFKIRADPSRFMKVVKELIESTKLNFPIDTNRIYITGVSSGGFGAFDAIMRYPNTFAAALPVCAAGDPRQAETIAHIPLWMVQGARDPIVEPAWSQQILVALTEIGAAPGYTQYPETGHYVWHAAYDDDMIMDWLFGQNKE